MSELWHWLEIGGVMLIAIALTSVVGVALFVARLRSYRRHRVLPGEVRRRVLGAVERGDWRDARTVLEQERSALGRVFLEGLRFRGSSRRELKEAMEEVGQREMSRLERYVGAVGAAASVAPLMGLLGTVLGMIRVFQSVVNDASAQGVVDPTALAGGIWEALITTAAGLSVAIPLYLGYRYLIGKWEALAGELEEAASELLDLLAPPPNIAVEVDEASQLAPNQGAADEVAPLSEALAAAEGA